MFKFRTTQIPKEKVRQRRRHFKIYNIHKEIRIYISVFLCHSETIRVNSSGNFEKKESSKKRKQRSRRFTDV